ncbi:helix-turn-helix domain-containing protein [Acetobacteraceae bacterium KSS12]|uniref:Helix-turn-helix domain-containing protein n=2 Tax=Rhizosaccharibacter radicis TaxID=2782605 RepID=A0ABT1VYW0_9PROT|nr:helix-turn-helix domain-containing protein [Acetobacteraceae bacterium KSS12]
MTQARLARFTGVSRSAVAQWESDRAGYSSGMLGRIAEVLGVSVAMLREGWGGLASDSILSADEMTLLSLFRQCEPSDRAVLLQLARRIAGSAEQGDAAETADL